MPTPRPSRRQVAVVTTEPVPAAEVAARTEASEEAGEPIVKTGEETRSEVGVSPITDTSESPITRAQRRRVARWLDVPYKQVETQDEDTVREHLAAMEAEEAEKAVLVHADPGSVGSTLDSQTLTKLAEIGNGETTDAPPTTEVRVEPTWTPAEKRLMLGLTADEEPAAQLAPPAPAVPPRAPAVQEASTSEDAGDYFTEEQIRRLPFVAEATPNQQDFIVRLANAQRGKETRALHFQILAQSGEVAKRDRMLGGYARRIEELEIANHNLTNSLNALNRVEALVNKLATATQVQQLSTSISLQTQRVNGLAALGQSLAQIEGAIAAVGTVADNLEVLTHRIEDLARDRDQGLGQLAQQVRQDLQTEVLGLRVLIEAQASTPAEPTQRFPFPRRPADEPVAPTPPAAEGDRFDWTRLDAEPEPAATGRPFGLPADRPSTASSPTPPSGGGDTTRRLRR